MTIYPTFYFCPLPSELILSQVFKITLRNPKPDEAPIFQQSIKSLTARLSDKERRKILYTLYPLGNFNSEGTLEEQFVRVLSTFWVLSCTDQTLPFNNSLVDYGFLCGHIVDHQDMMNPSGFIADIKTLTPRMFLRSLKKQIPKAAKILCDPSLSNPDLKELEQRASYWDGLLTQSPRSIKKYLQLAQTLKDIQDAKQMTHKFLNYCIAAEILLVHNPSKSAIKTPIHQQFSNKLALVRHIVITQNQQQILHNPSEMQEIFNKIYELRSQLVHGDADIKISNRLLTQYLNLLHTSIRLAIQLKIHDPMLIEFLYKI